MKNYYKILGVKRDASEEEIREQWVEWMRKLHPDQHAGKEGEDQKIKEINEAYQVLKHSSTRMEYDLKLAYGHKERRSYSLKWAFPMVMMAVILVMAAVYMRKPKSTVPSPQIVAAQTTESRSQNSEVSNQTNQKNQKEQPSTLRSRSPIASGLEPSALSLRSPSPSALRSPQPELRSQETEVRIQKPVIISQQPEVSDKKNETDRTDQANQTNQRNETNQRDLKADLPQSPKITVASASEGDQVIQMAQTTPEPMAPPTQRRIDSPTQRRDEPTTQRRNDPATPEPMAPPTPKRVEPPTQRLPDSPTQRRDDPTTLRLYNSPTPEPMAPPTPKRVDPPTQRPYDATTPKSLIASEEEVKQFFSRYVERYNQKDLEGFFSLFSKKATQNRQNKVEDIRKVYSDFFNQSERIRYHLFDIKTEIYQNALEVRARYELVQTLKQGGDRVWKGTIRWTLVKENGVLKILSLEYQPQKSP